MADVTAAPSRITPSPITPGPITPGPITPGPITPGPITPGPITPRPGTPRTAVAAHALGSVAVGSVLIWAAFTAAKSSPAPLAPAVGFDILLVTPELIVLVAIGVALVRPLRRFAWLVAAAGTFGVAALFYQGTALDRDQLFTVLAICTGLQFGGVLLALAAADRTSRWAIAVGLGAGGAAGTYGLSLLIRAAREGIFAGTTHGDDAMIALLGALAAAAGLLLLLRTAEASERPDSSSAMWGPVIWVLIAAAVAVGLSWLWQLVLDNISQASTGGLSQERAVELETMDLLARGTIGVGAGLIIFVLALRRGGPNLARWVVVAFGLGASSVALPVSLGAIADVVALFLVPAAVGAFAGAGLVRFADRWYPWDALGLAMIAFVVLRALTPPPIEPTPSALIVIGTFGLGLALTAGLARLTDPAENGLAPDDAAMSAALGVAALVLCQQVISPVPFLGRQDIQGPRLTVPLVIAAAALLVAVLFWLGRRTMARPDAADQPADRQAEVSERG